MADYYAASSSSLSVPQVAIPLLCLQADDDPIAPKEAIPTDALLANPNCILVNTRWGTRALLRCGCCCEEAAVGLAAAPRVLVQEGRQAGRLACQPAMVRGLHAPLLAGAVLSCPFRGSTGCLMVWCAVPCSSCSASCPAAPATASMCTSASTGSSN